MTNKEISNNNPEKELIVDKSISDDKAKQISNKKKLKEAKTIVGKEPIFKNKSIKLKTIRMIGNWNEGDIIIGSSFFDFVLNIGSSK